MVEFVKHPSVKLKANLGDDVMLCAALNATQDRGGKDSSEIELELRSMSENQRLKTIKGTFRRSMGKGHIAALDFPAMWVEKKIPRIESMRDAKQSQGLVLIQESTRDRPVTEVYIPENISESFDARADFQGTIREVMKDYERIVKGATESRDRRAVNILGGAMYMTPLYSMTKLDEVVDGRALWMNRLEAESVGSEISSKVVESMWAQIPNELSIAMKDRKRVKDLREFHPSGIDFLLSENPELEALAAQHDLIPGEVVYLSHHDPMPEVWNDSMAVIRGEKRHNMSAFQAAVLGRTDASLMHEIIRHGTIVQIWEPLQSAAEHAEFTIPESMERMGYGEVVKDNSERLVRLYQRLVERGVPKEDAVGVLPHSLNLNAYLSFNGWSGIHFAKNRLCGAAKPEIRDFVENVKGALQKSAPRYARLMLPKGVYLGKCAEAKSVYDRCSVKCVRQ